MPMRDGIDRASTLDFIIVSKKIVTVCSRQLLRSFELMGPYHPPSHTVVTVKATTRRGVDRMEGRAVKANLSVVR